MEQNVLKKNAKELIEFMMELNLLERSYDCIECLNVCRLVAYTRNKDGMAWRCMNPRCKRYKKYTSLRINSFFAGWTISLPYFLRIICRYACNTQRFSINRSFDIAENTILKVINALVSKMPTPNFVDNKLGGPGFIVQIDETMLNYKCKSHRGRSPSNYTDALCIVEVKDGHVTRAYACVIPNKAASTTLPIIQSQVVPNSIIWTDEHKTYTALSKNGYNHSTVCHKYNFVAHDGTNTQSVESFNNCIKLEIKRRKGVWTIKREEFLKEVCFLFNHRHNLLDELINLLKIQ